MLAAGWGVGLSTNHIYTVLLLNSDCTVLFNADNASCAQRSAYKTFHKTEELVYPQCVLCTSWPLALSWGYFFSSNLVVFRRSFQYYCTQLSSRIYGTHVFLKIYKDLFSMSVTVSSLLRQPTVLHVTLLNHQTPESILQWVASN